MEKRLEKLTQEVAKQRQKEFIKFWSDEIRNEAILLSEVFSVVHVSKKTLLLRESIKKWIKNKENSSLKKKEDKISVTRIVANKPEQILEKKILLACILKNKIELQIYNKEVLENLVERFFI